MTFNRILVVQDSSNVKQINYSTETRHMVVVYAGGEKYLFTRVPNMVFAHLATAPSVGTELNSYTSVHPGKRLSS